MARKGDGGGRAGGRSGPGRSLARRGATSPGERGAEIVPQAVGQDAGGVEASYVALLEQLKADIAQARVRAALAANRELIALYWRIGAAIVERQRSEGWGRAVIERLARDLRQALPGAAGFSPRNLWRMRAFYLAYTQEVTDGGQVLPQVAAELDGATLPQAAAELPWMHNVLLMERVEEPAVRLWYARAAARHGWSRSVLELHVANRLHARQGAAVTNFETTLPSPDSDLAREALKDPYVFDFLTLAEDAQEREIERGLMAHVERFLLELGAGFAFVGRQMQLEVNGNDFYVDLVFYHLQLRCFVVIDLKAVPFRPEFAGQINFYCSVVDDVMRKPGDGPTIGLLLCKGKDRVVAEYALRGMTKPIGVADWAQQLTESLPDELKGRLPTVEELERELGASAEHTE